MDDPKNEPHANECTSEEDGTGMSRVTEGQLDALIDHVYYFTAREGVIGAMDEGTAEEVPVPSKLGRMTFCIITLKSGFQSVGYSTVLDPKNYTRAVGERMAFTQAKENLWELEGYHRMAAKAGM